MSTAISYENVMYPDRLLCMAPENPQEIHVEGRLPELERATVAIVGARMCSEYGRYMARVFGQELGAAGFQIITDMSIGVGGIAAKGALAVEADVFAVMGCATDVCYPPEHRMLYDEIKSKGGIISEYPDGTLPTRAQFQTRNRIIAALADVIVVIEARRKSGVLVTADHAIRYGKRIYALPGRATDRLSDGTNELIRDGNARVAITPKDVIDTFRVKFTEVA